MAPNDPYWLTRKHDLLIQQAWGSKRFDRPASVQEEGQDVQIRAVQGDDLPIIARSWLKRLGHGLDGIVAKRLDLPYQPANVPRRSSSCGRLSIAL